MFNKKLNTNYRLREKDNYWGQKRYGQMEAILSKQVRRTIEEITETKAQNMTINPDERSNSIQMEEVSYNVQPYEVKKTM